MKRPSLSCRGNAENNETTERFPVKPSIFLATLAVALLLPFAAFAADAGQFVDVVATGHGSTVREATKAALRAAVEQVVGTMVDATTLVENDEQINNDSGRLPCERSLRVPLGTFSANELKVMGKLEIKVGHVKNGQFVE